MAINALEIDVSNNIVERSEFKFIRRNTITNLPLGLEEFVRTPFGTVPSVPFSILSFSVALVGVDL